MADTILTKYTIRYELFHFILFFQVKIHVRIFVGMNLIEYEPHRLCLSLSVKRCKQIRLFYYFNIIETLNRYRMCFATKQKNNIQQIRLINYITVKHECERRRLLNHMHTRSFEYLNGSVEDASKLTIITKKERSDATRRLHK